MPEVDANGLLVHYEEEGDGPPLVLLHGATSVGPRDWGAQRPLLRQHFRLLMPDARAHGGDALGCHARLAAATTLVDDLAAFLDALGLDRGPPHGPVDGRCHRTALREPASRAGRWPWSSLACRDRAPSPPRSVARRQLDLARIDREDPAFAAEMARLHDRCQGAGAWRRLMTALRDDIALGAGLAPEELSRVRAARPARLRRRRSLGAARAGRPTAPPAAGGTPPRGARRPCRAGRAAGHLQPDGARLPASARGSLTDAAGPAR